MKMIFLDFQINILRYLGVFSPKTSSKIILFTFYAYRTFIFIMFSYFTVTMTIQMFMTTDLAILTRTIDMWTMYISGMYKWCYMTLFNKDFAKLNNKLNLIQALGSTTYNQSADQFMVNYLKKIRKITLWYLFSGIVSSFLIDINPFITYPQRDRSDIEYFNDANSYPYSCWIPFTIHNFWMFVALFMYHFFMSIFIALFYLSNDSFMFGSLYIAGGQLDLLNHSVMNTIDSMTEIEVLTRANQLVKFTEKQQNKLSSKLRECIKHHISILKFIQDLRTLFSSLIMIDYLHGVISLSFALFQLTISTSVNESITTLFFILVTSSHQFLNNYFGEYIVHKQILVRSTVNQIPWWRANKEIRNKLLLMILRSQKPIFIRGLYLYKLCNASFVTFVKSLYTYYMVLRHLAAENKKT